MTDGTSQSEDQTIENSDFDSGMHGDADIEQVIQAQVDAADESSYANDMLPYSFAKKHNVLVLSLIHI